MTSETMADKAQIDHGPAIPRDAKQQSHVRKATEQLRSAARATADEYRGRAGRVWDETLHRVRSFQDGSKEYIRDNPKKAVCTALVVGFVLGLIFRR
jgi:ElaB/YqjD/DUF883 family membrane-anchored ribosome-binding protein